MNDNKPFGAHNECPGHLDPWADASPFEQTRVGYNRALRSFSNPSTTPALSSDHDGVARDPISLRDEGLLEADTEIEFLEDALGDLPENPGSSLAGVNSSRDVSFGSDESITAVNHPPTKSAT